MENLFVTGLKSKTITPGDRVMEYLTTALKEHPLQEKDILVITSKVIAVGQGRVAGLQNFQNLIEQEADEVIGGEPVVLTQKNNIFTPWAGIDRSNAPEGQVVLWPEKPYEAAFQLLKELKQTYGIRKLGLIISDSSCVPLRRGVVAIALGYAGFRGVNDLRGNKDLYGRPMEVSQQNMADMLATSAHLVMGEAAESIPFALVRGANIQFTDEKTDPNEITISRDECLFRPLY